MGHDGSQSCAWIAGGLWFGAELEFIDEGSDDAIGGGSIGRKGNGMAIGVLQRLDVRIFSVPVIGCAGCLSADNADRRALRISRHGAKRANRQSEIDA